ncbi:hypothetical protein PybrP1_011339 [[Pythium] brassicae (nom. inval.)]|nr:hypothetical protein PybrP1_011339 [[Pythium] brassicae (nom. inval.)]
MGSARARRPQTISTAAQAENAWSVLQGGKREQTNSLHITALCFSETLLRPHACDQLPSTLCRVFSAPSVMASLYELDLSYNNLNDAFWACEWAAVPSTGLWTALTSVNFANNIEREDPRCSPLHLLYDALEGKRLTVLDLSCTKLSDRDVSGLLETAAFRQLIKLFLRSNALRDATAIQIAQLLPGASLQVLSLAGNQIRNRGLGAIAFAIESSRALQTLDLEANQINERGVLTLYHTLDGLAAPFPLRSVHLHRNQIPRAHERRLLAALHVKLQEKILETHLLAGAKQSPQTTLSLTGTTLRRDLRMDSVLNDRYTNVALDTLRQCDAWSCLEELDLSGNALSERGCCAIGLYVSLHPRLRVLNLSGSGIDDQAIGGLADGLESNATLEELNLHDNEITDSGAKRLYLKAFTSNLQRKVLLSVGNQLSSECKAMLAAISQAHDLRKRFAREFDHLERLDFAGRGLRQYGVAAIVEMLTAPTCLLACTTIDLSRNGLGDDGAHEVARLLRGYPPLTKIDLSFNDIGDAGAFALADALQDNATLTSFSLHTSVDGSRTKPKLLEPGLTRLAHALEGHAAITTVDLRDNVATPALVPVYVQLLRRNPRVQKFNGSSAAVYLSRYEA